MVSLCFWLFVSLIVGLLDGFFFVLLCALLRLLKWLCLFGACLLCWQAGTHWVDFMCFVVMMIGLF